MRSMGEHAPEDLDSTEETRDYEAFRRNNRIRVNRLLNKILWVCILAGPAIAFGIAGGVFKQTSYTTCIVISVAMAVVAGGNLLILRKLPYSFIPGILALISMEFLLCYMNASRISIRLTWFLVPLLSLLFCESKVYIGVSLFNMMVMGVSTWFEASHYADIRIDFASPIAGFVNIFAGGVIEALLMFIAGYALGSLTENYFRRMKREYAEAQEQQDKMHEQMDILESMAEIYDYVNLIDFNDSTEMSLREERLRKLVIENGQDHTQMTQGLKSKVAADMVDDFWEFTNITTVPERLLGRRSIAGEFVNNETGWFRAQYIRVKGNLEQKPDVVIYTVQTIDADKRKEEHLIRISMTDELTRLFNRRSYEKDLSEIESSGSLEGLSLISADVNDLKTVNDNHGHSAGDELIQGAASCLISAIGPQGKVYRVGGDEFMVIVRNADCQKLVGDIREKTASWRGDEVGELSMSVGYASAADHPNISIKELERISDRAMYDEKDSYYQQPDHDRRNRI